MQKEDGQIKEAMREKAAKAAQSRPIKRSLQKDFDDAAEELTHDHHDQWVYRVCGGANVRRILLERVLAALLNRAGLANVRRLPALPRQVWVS